MLFTFLDQADGVARQFAFIHFVNSDQLPNRLFHRIAFLKSVDYARANLIKSKVIFRVQIQKYSVVANFLNENVLRQSHSCCQFHTRKYLTRSMRSSLPRGSLQYSLILDHWQRAHPCFTAPVTQPNDIEVKQCFFKFRRRKHSFLHADRFQLNRGAVRHFESPAGLAWRAVLAGRDSSCVAYSAFDVGYSMLIMIRTSQILGIRFFNGDVGEAVALMLQRGGLLVAPSGTCFARMREDEMYRRAVLAADLAIADSGLMVVLWRLLRGERVQRISGLKYLKHLLGKLKGEGTRDVFWVLPTEAAQQKLFDWSRREAFSINKENCYVAPRYASEVQDRNLLALIEQHRAAHVLIAIGSGAQEKLGFYLRENLSYRPAIHCIGAALGFITGDQAAIPDWVDRFYLGWLWRLVAQPSIFVPRLSRALELPWLIWKYGEKLPPMRGRI